MNRNSNLYKIDVLVVKIFPFLLATIILINSIFNCFEYLSITMDYIYLISVYVFVLLSSISFKFCVYHRLPLHYVAIMKAIHIYDLYYPLECEYFTKLNLYSIIACVFIFLTVYLYVKDNKKSFRKSNK